MSAISLTAEKPIQAYYAQKYDECYGCGPQNPDGLQIESYWNGETATAEFVPLEKHKGLEGFVYGGLIASLIDCHAMAVAAASWLENASEPDQKNALPRFVTGSLTVRYVKPTPLNGSPIELSAQVTDQKKRRSTIKVIVSVNGSVTAEGEVIAFHIPETME